MMTMKQAAYPWQSATNQADWWREILSAAALAPELRARAWAVIRRDAKHIRLGSAEDQAAGCREAVFEFPDGSRLSASFGADPPNFDLVRSQVELPLGRVGPSR
jgi:hypothetical protein